MKRVEFAERHFVEQTLDLFLGEKMAAYVQHYPTPSESWLVFYLNTGHAPWDTGYQVAGEDFRRQQLEESLRAVKQARRLWRTDDNGIGCDGELVTFRTVIRISACSRQQDRAL